MYGLEYPLLIILGIVIGTYLKTSPKFNTYLLERNRSPFSSLFEQGSISFKVIHDENIEDSFILRCFKKNTNGEHGIRLQSVHLTKKEGREVNVIAARNPIVDGHEITVVDNPHEDFELIIH